MANRAEPDPGPRARPGPSRSLTLDEITAAAVRVADAGGLTATTMRSIAAEVGLSAAGLYRYVTSRDELIGQMVDRLSAEVPHPEADRDKLEAIALVNGAAALFAAPSHQADGFCLSTRSAAGTRRGSERGVPLGGRA